jgi:uroporphyrinogen-III synthase
VKQALLLRAREDAARTGEKLRALGYAPVLSPVLEIVATHAPLPNGDFDAVLASSAKGVEAVADFSKLESLPFHLVGAKTAAAARARGLEPHIVAGAAETILPVLISTYERPAHFLYLAGRDRQPALEAGLRAKGHRITAVDVYEARAATSLTEAARDALRANSIDVALHYSRRSVEIFLRLAEIEQLTPALSKIRALALSQDVATPLRAMGLRVGVAARPDEAGLLALLGESP